MENLQYFLLILNLIIVWLLVILFTKIKSSDSNIFVRELSEFRHKLTEMLTDKFIQLFKENKENEKNIRTEMEKFFLTVSDKVDKKLDQWFQKTNETFAKIIERMAKIDEAQKNIEKLSTDVVSLQSLLSDSKSRWIFGEIQLDSILANIFGDDNSKFYEMQYHFKDNKTIVDCVVKTPQWLIPIDSKFPLTNYQKMYHEKLSKQEKDEFKKLFISGIKKQIDDISSKYIIHGKTIDSALMFIPAESVFAELHTHYFDIVEYAHSKRVNIVSPTTLMAMLTIILISMKSQETQKQAKIIQSELWWLSIEFNRFADRRGKFTRDFEKVHNDVSLIDVTNKKIIWKFESIEKLEFSNNIEKLRDGEIEE